MSGAAGLFISRNFRLLLRFQKYPVHVAALPRFVTAGGFLSMSFKDEELKKRLTPLQYQVTQEKGTEMAFTGEYEKNKEPGMYNCVVCGEPLFKSDHKYDSGSGWPSFDRPVDDKNIQRNSDKSLGRERTEVVCKKCQAHLGHVFTDGPASTGERYCINSASLAFDKKKKDEL